MTVNIVRSKEDLCKALGVRGIVSYIDVPGLHAIVIPIRNSELTKSHIQTIHDYACSCVKSLDTVDFSPLMNKTGFDFPGGHAYISYEFPNTFVILNLEVE